MRIAVVGSYGTGLTFDVDVAPVAGETIQARGFRVEHGGKGSNQSIGAARLGADVALLTAVGCDDYGANAIELWEKERVGVEHLVRVANEPTMVGLIVVERSGENRIAIAPGALLHFFPSHVDQFEPEIASADLCLVGLEIPIETAFRALLLAKRHGVTTVLNPAPAPINSLPPALLELCDYITPNLTEAMTLVGHSASPENLAHDLLDMGARAVVMTLGSEGALVAKGNEMHRVPILPASEVVDTTGAGDAFNAAFSVAIARGCNITMAARLGCVAGKLSVQAHGAILGLPSLAALKAALALEDIDCSEIAVDI